MNNTPETQKAVLESNGQWSFILKECCERLERERDEALEQNAKLRDIAERLFAAGVGRMKTDDWRTLRAELDQLKEGGKCPVCTEDEKCWECADDVSTEGGK